ncbi:MAG: Rrf2 family transcriptional regulator [Candidatus Gastranaerophilales bacterium]|nr:Rrf2 family transcriptional regulator [Candidatus Gastranaerophilales bacterium]
MSVIKISEAASIAIHSTVLLALNPERMRSTKEIAAILGVSEAHLAKVMQMLVKANFVNSIRGPKGGFILKKSPEEIKLSDIYVLIDGQNIPKTCGFHAKLCEDVCVIDKLTASLTNEFNKILEKTSITDIIKKFN